jgi:FAD/FMN-containing dehydrogenase
MALTKITANVIEAGAISTASLADTSITADIDDWIENAALNRARLAKEQIIADLIRHCNENDIALAVGEAAQVTQAFELGVAEVYTDVPFPS